MNSKKANEMDIVDYLSGLGHHPTKIKEADYWYSSPLHDEQTPSFKINRRINKWKDWGSGEGGNLVDFGIRYYRCSVSEFLQKLATPGQSTLANWSGQKYQDCLPNEKKEIKIQTIKPITSLPLIQYYRSRRIPDNIANYHLKEVHYELDEKKYYALGFKNNAFGYALRNQYIKAASSPNDCTFINKEFNDLAVFEGFFDFLSYLTMNQQQDIPKRNFLILNSTSFFNKNLTLMQEHKSVHLFLDTNKTGQECTQKAISLDRVKFIDERPLYRNYDDLNHWLTEMGLSLKTTLRQKP